MITDIPTPTIDAEAIQIEIREKLEGVDSSQVSKDIFTILTQAYKQIVQAPSTFSEEPVSETEKQDPNWRKYKAPDMNVMRARIKEKAQRELIFNQLIYPTLVDIKNSTHYEVFKTFVAKVLDQQETAREAKNEHIYVLAKHSISETIRSIIK